MYSLNIDQNVLGQGELRVHVQLVRGPGGDALALPSLHGNYLSTSCIFIFLNVGSHCRSDQLDHSDPLSFPIEPDLARLKGVYTTSSRSLVNHRRSIIQTYTRALHDLNSTNYTSARSPPDLHPNRSGCDVILLE